MNDDLISKLTTLLEDNLIPYMEIVESSEHNIDATIKVYYPKIMLNICKFLDKKFTVENKEEIFMKKDEEGYHFIEISLLIQNKQTTLRLHSMLQNTWGIENEY